LALQTQNFSGAELERLVRAATSIAMNRLVNVSTTTDTSSASSANTTTCTTSTKNQNVKLLDIDSLKVTMCDFQHAIFTNDDIVPAFGNRCRKNYIHNGIIVWSDTVSSIIDDMRLLINQTRNSTPLVTILLEGDPGSGKTAMAAYMANQTDFPFMCLKI
jgi:vesicle-fusing ATPase